MEVVGWKGKLRVCDVISEDITLKINFYGSFRKFNWRKFDGKYFSDLMDMIQHLYKVDNGDLLFRLQWIDSDGDLIQVATDEEMAVALNEMPGPVYKFDLIPVVEHSFGC